MTGTLLCMSGVWQVHRVGPFQRWPPDCRTLAPGKSPSRCNSLETKTVLFWKVWGIFASFLLICGFDLFDYFFLIGVIFCWGIVLADFVILFSAVSPVHCFHVLMKGVIHGSYLFYPIFIVCLLLFLFLSCKPLSVFANSIFRNIWIFLKYLFCVMPRSKQDEFWFMPCFVRVTFLSLLFRCLSGQCSSSLHLPLFFSLPP